MADINTLNGAIIAGSDGDDVINNKGSNVSINGGAGNDSIYISYSNVLKNTIIGGAGDDTIILNAYTTGNHLIKYAAGDGNDLINNYREDDTISIGGAQYKSATVNSDVIIQIIGSGYITLSGAAEIPVNILGEPVNQNTVSSITISGTDSEDYIENRGNAVTIIGGAGNDSIINYGNNPTVSGISYGRDAIINGGAGNDTIYNNGAGASVNGDTGDDTISNASYGVNATIHGGGGSDSIFNNAQAQIYGGTGKDTLTNSNSGAGASLFGEDGDDYITSSNAENVLLDGGGGADYLYAGGNVKGVTLRGGKGNDSIVGHTGNTHGLTFEYNFGDGNDTIFNYTAADTITFDDSVIYTRETVGADVILNINDTNTITIINAAEKTLHIHGGNEGSYKINISNFTKNTLLTGSAENDTFRNAAVNVTVDALEGDDFISNNSSYVSISAGDGADTVSLSGVAGDMTVKGGKGADLIQNVSSVHGGRVYQYSLNDGNDTITNANSNDTLQLTGGYFTVKRNGNDFLVYSYGSPYTVVDENYSGAVITFKNTKYLNVISPNQSYSAPIGTSKNDSLENYLSYETINALGGNDYIYNAADNVTIDGGKGADTVSLYYGAALSIFGGDGNDSIYFNHSSNFTADGGAGNDTISGYFSSGKVEGGGGNDLINFNGANNTIGGGAGNDTVSLGGDASLTQYIYSGGNDIIYGFTNTDSLKISGSISKSSISGDNVILKTSGGTVTLAGMAGETFYLNGKVTIYGGYILPTGLSASGTTLTASGEFEGDSISLADYDSALTNVNASGVRQNLKLTGNAENNYLRGGMGDDTISGGKGSDTLTGNTGADIFVYAKTETYITDYAAGVDKIKLEKATIQGSSISGNDLIFNFKSGESLTVANGKNKEITIIDSAGKESSQIYGHYSYNSARNMITLNENFSGTLTAAEYDSKVKTINASKVTNSAAINGNSQANTIQGGAANDSIYGGAGADSIFGGNGNDYLSGEAGNDTLFGGSGNDTLTGGAGKDIFLYSAGNDVIADFSSDDKISLKSGAVTNSSLYGADIIFTIGNGTLNVKNAKDTEITIGKNIYYNNLVYDSKKSVATLGASFSGSLAATSTLKEIDGSNVSNSIAITGNSKANTITGGRGNDNISGGGGNDKLYGGAGADTLFGGAGNDTLTGGDGKDIFLYGAGNDVIADFTNDDSISLSSGAVSSATLKGSDMVFKIGRGSLTVKDAQDLDIKIGDNIYNGEFTYNLNKSAVTLAAGFKGTLTANSNLREIDASNVTRKIVIEGNNQNNFINGGAGNDTIYGGAGADSVVGNAGNDYILGGDGNDTLFGGKGNDTLTGGKGADTFIYSAGKDTVTDYTAAEDKIIFEGKVSKVLYKNGDAIFKMGDGTLTVKDGEGKRITVTDSSGTSIYSKTLDLFEDNNFISDVAQISDITAPKVSVTQIQTSNADELEQPVLTFADEK